MNDNRHREEQRDDAIQAIAKQDWIVSLRSQMTNSNIRDVLDLRRLLMQQMRRDHAECENRNRAQQ
jgi:hypothetical protein